MAAEETTQPQQPVESIDLAQSPFGDSFGEGTEVASLGKLLQLFLKGSKKAAPEAAEQAADGTPIIPITRGADDPIPKARPGVDEGVTDGALPEGTPAIGEAVGGDTAPLIGDMVPTPPGGAGGPPGAPPAGLPPGGTPDAPLEGQVMPEILTGTTRQSPNPNYFNDPGTQEVLNRLEEFATRPPVEGWAHTEAGAAAVADITQLMGKPPSLDWSPGELLKLRQIADEQAQSVKVLADRLNVQIKEGASPGAEDLAEFEIRSANLIATQNAIAGLATQAGRMLNSLQIRVGSPAAVNRQIADVVRQRGGPGTIEQRIALVAQGTNPHKAVQRSFASKVWNEALKWRYNMMLSSVRTHAGNISGNTMSTALENAIDIAAVINNQLLINPASRLLHKTGYARTVQDQLPWASIGAGVAGDIKGTTDGLAVAWRIAKNDPATRDATGGIGKWMNDAGMRVRPGEEGLFGMSNSPAVRTAGVALSTPTRMLEAEDAFFRAVAYWRRLNTLAMDKAAVEAGSDLALRKQLYNNYTTNPSEELVQQSRDYAAKLTFTSNPDIYGRLVGEAANIGKRISGHPVGNLILPFVNTPANLTGYVLEKMSAGVITKPTQLMRDLLGQGSAREQAEAFVAVEIAAALPFILYPLWEGGLFTGVGSTNWATNQTMETKGWLPGALQWNDKYYSMKRLDPLGQILAVYASAFEFSKENDIEGMGDASLAMMSAVLSTADVLKDRAFLSSLAEFMAAIESGKAGAKFMLNLTASAGGSFVVPGFFRDIRMMNDPVSRSLMVDYTNNEGVGGGLWRRFTNIIANGYPVGSQNLPPRIDWRGDVITNEGGKIWRGIMPIPMREVKDDNATAWLLQNHVTPRKPAQRLTIQGAQGRVKLDLLELDPEGHIYAFYQSIVGEERLKAVEMVIKTKGFKAQMDAGLMGRDSVAGDTLSKALSLGKRVADARLLRWLNNGGGELELAGATRNFDISESLQLDNIKAATLKYLMTGDKPEPGALKFKTEANTHIPKNLQPSNLKTGINF